MNKNENEVYLKNMLKVLMDIDDSLSKELTEIKLYKIKVLCDYNFYRIITTDNFMKRFYNYLKYKRDIDVSGYSVKFNKMITVNQLINEIEEALFELSLPSQ